MPISRPMMPPPMTSIFLGWPRNSSAPVLSTMRGSCGRNGRRTACEPAARMARLKADGLRLAGGLLGLAGRFLDLQVLGVEQLAQAPHDGDLAHLGHCREPAGHLAEDLGLVSTQLVQVDGRCAERDTQVGEVRHLVHHRRHMQQGLGRDAANVQADAPQRRVALDEHHLEAEVGRRGTRPSNRRGRHRAREHRIRGRHRRCSCRQPARQPLQAQPPAQALPPPGQTPRQPPPLRRWQSDRPG